MKVSIKKLWEQMVEKHDALIAEGNYGESYETLMDLMQYLDECRPYKEDELIELIKANNISLKEVTE